MIRALNFEGVLEQIYQTAEYSFFIIITVALLILLANHHKVGTFY